MSGYNNFIIRGIDVNRVDIINVISLLKFPITEYWLGYGAALCLYGIKETTKDIDCGCSPMLFNELIRKGYKVEKSPMGGDMIRINEHVDFFYEEYPPESSLIYIWGIQVQTLESIREEKLQRGREKDLADVKLIDESIARGD